MAQSSHGKIYIFNDFMGEEIQANPAIEHASATGALFNLSGGLTIKGQNLDQAATGAAAVEDGLNGQILLTTSAAAGGDGTIVTTETCFKPSVNAPMILEVRCEMAALTLRRVFIGFSGTVADAQSTICSGTTETIALTETNLAGFLFDSGLTTDVDWHMVYNGGSTTGVTVSTSLDATKEPTQGEMQVLRIEVDNNGTARWFVNGDLLQTVTGAVSTTAVFGACAGVWATAATTASLTLDYFELEACRDWTV